MVSDTEPDVRYVERHEREASEVYRIKSFWVESE
jgi:hypothetical protein